MTRAAFAGPMAEPGFRSFHWPRIERWARAFLAWDEARRGDLDRLLLEEKGRLALPLADGSTFTLSAEADRIEVDRDGARDDHRLQDRPAARRARSRPASRRS